LEQAGHQVFWLSPNTRWARWLLKQGVPDERVLDLSRHGTEWSDGTPPTDQDLARLRSLEAKGTLRINDIIMMDPLLVRRPRDHALKYLSVCERLVREFMTSNGIGAVTAEQTWAFELLVGQVCVSIGIPHMMPHTIRIPDSRFGFFVGHTEAHLLPLREPTHEDNRIATSFLAEFRARKPKPSYMTIDRRILKPDLARLATLTRHVLDLVEDRFDETSLRPLGLVLSHTQQLFRKIRNSRSGRFMPRIESKRPFVFFPLHLQPEASIDVKGSPFTPQLEIVRAIARSLPLTHDLYVKEHAVALKTRPHDFYRAVSQIPSVRLISPNADSFSLIAAADLVVTVTGTAAYEAALLGRPAATIAPIFFDRVVAYRQFDPWGDRVSDLLLAEGRGLASDDEIVAFLAWLIAQSFPGTVGDAFWQPDSLSQENLELVSRGFHSAFTHVSSHPVEF
jgi:hypothetical protein